LVELALIFEGKPGLIIRISAGVLGERGLVRVMTSRILCAFDGKLRAAQVSKDKEGPIGLRLDREPSGPSIFSTAVTISGQAKRQWPPDGSELDDVPQCSETTINIKN